jgi:hypothetical protein
MQCVHESLISFQLGKTTNGNSFVSSASKVASNVISRVRDFVTDVCAVDYDSAYAAA